MAVPNQRGVASTHPGYDKYAPKWRRCRDVSDGQDAIHAARETYLPKLKGEEDDQYAARIKRSNFFNGSWRTIAILVGMLFRKPPQVELSAGVVEYLKDVDLAGTTIDTFARTVAMEVLEVGRIGLLVDHPAVENVSAITVAAAQQQGLRPSIQTYRAECIINWKYRRIRNRHVLAMVVLKEVATEPDGEFAEKSIDQYRVLDLVTSDRKEDKGAEVYRIRIFQRVKEQDVQIGGDAYPLMNGKKLDYIPFAIVGVDGVDSDLDEPPLIDLIDANIAHYQINADYRHGLHFTGLPTLFLSGIVQDEAAQIFHIGGTAAITSPHADARGMFIEFTGQGLNAIRDALKELKQEMALLGARAIADETKQAETLGATQIKRAGENSILSSIAMAVSEALEWSLGIFSEWAGQGGEVVYQLNRDFNPAMIDAQQLTALVAAVQAGKISDRELFGLLQRGDVIDSEVKFDEHQAEVEMQAGPVKPEPKPIEEAA